ncbi:diacylglycerol kinase family protein [Vibrio aphrogenes]|uniref:diacylglycerol kinase family protein n=1 Tax=Vibrio aphrogenes TaxID=1891186 RepID=UPI000B35C33A|nr:diacylglycerol kinase family protein [Vibrio aphrogenes]
MLVTKYYIAGSLVFYVLALLCPNFWLSLPLAWIALSLSIVSIAYLCNFPHLFRKKPNGVIPNAMQWLLAPFLIGAHYYNYWARTHDSVAPIQRIDPQLYLARRLFSKDLKELKAQGITSILDITAEFHGLQSGQEDRDFDYFNLPVLDHKVPSKRKLIKALDWMDVQLADSKKVVVHCALGRGRSVFVLAAYLLRRYPRMSIEEVMQKIQTIRTTARLNKEQMAMLQQLHRQQAFQTEPTLWLIVNPVSGGGKWGTYQEAILDKLTAQYHVEIRETTRDLSAAELTKQALNSGATFIVAGGGDGTVTEVANQIVHTDIVLGILPLGTANALCHVLYGIENKIIPVETACNAILQGEVTQIDTARCNQNLILLVAGIGFEQKMIEYAEREQKNNDGQFAYLKGLWGAVTHNDTLSLQVSLDKQPAQALEVSSLVIANAAPFTTLLAQGGGEPDLQDGILDITYLPSHESIAGRFLSLSELALSNVLPTAEPIGFVHQQAKEVLVTSERPFKYVIDGELYETEQLSIYVQPRSLNVMVPSWFTEQ